MKILVTGNASPIGKRFVEILLGRGHVVIGLDRRGFWHSEKFPEDKFKHYQCDVRKRAAEDVFRKEKPKGVIHLATVSHLQHLKERGQRMNLGVTQKIVEFSHRYGVKTLAFVGRHTFYGAEPDSPLYHKEIEPPSMSSGLPALSDLVAADLYAGSALWRYPKIATSVLRICYTLGESKSGTLASFLKGPKVPTFLGYDPLFQIIHEEDAMNAVATAVEKNLRGVYNVAGPPPSPLSVVIRETGRERVTLPKALMGIAMGTFGLSKLPRGAWDHIRFPVLIDDSEFKKATGFEYKFDEAMILNQFKKS